MKKAMHPVALGLGGNVGQREEYLRKAMEALGRLMEHIRVSRIYESPALLPEGAPPEWNRPFLNMAAAGVTSLTPQELLAEAQRLEQELGRQRRGYWGPREIDIDLLLYDDLVMQDEQLTLPHPGLAERDFVLLPLAELLPDWRFPATGGACGMRIADMAERMRPRATARAFSEAAV